MADRTGSTERASISVSPATRDRLNEVIDALARQEGRSTTQDQLIRALLEGVPLWQADLMLRSYTRLASAGQVHDLAAESD